MARQQVFSPAPRLLHVSFSAKRLLYVWGGWTVDFEAGSEADRIKLRTCIEQFDPDLEVWRQLNTAGTPHPGVLSAACVSDGENVFMYGGYSGKRFEGVLSKLNLEILTWSQLSPETAGGPMRKESCGLIIIQDKLVLIGGYGIPTGPIQPQATFVKNTKFTDGRGWSNEIHEFNTSQGLWSSPTVRGVRPPPYAQFTLTSIDNHRAIMFGGYRPGHGRVNDLYIIDFNSMEFTKVEPCEGEPWPVARFYHAACCIGYTGDHIHLLVSGGSCKDNKPLNDVWLFDLSLKKWKEVTLPDGTPPRHGHSVTAITLCPGLENVTMFGGSTVKFQSLKKLPRISETTVITFIKEGATWVLVGVANSRQIGTSDRIRERMLKISEIARAAVDCTAQLLAISQVREMALQQMVEEAKAEVRELERRAAERVREVEQQLVERERVRVQELQQEYRRRMNVAEQQLVDRERAAEVRVQAAQQRARESEVRVQAAQQLARESEVRVQAAQQQARESEVRVQEAHQQAREFEVRVQAAEQQVRESDVRVQEAQQQAREFEVRVQAAQQQVRESEARVQEAQQGWARQVQESETRFHEAQLQVREYERTAGRLREELVQCERRARQAEALVQQNQEESHWLVQRREIDLTEEERGRGGWAVVKVANFRGTRVAAKCFYQQILVSRYNRQLFNREMNMAARLRHPNLVQFIGASLEGEPIILTELMTTSLRSELERGPIDHAHITSISLDVARALNYLHLMQPHPIIHRDVSSANVLLDPLPDNHWKAKLSDYGSVNLVRELRTVGPGSPVYAAPEANIPAHQSTKMDIFSFGVLLVEMLTDEFPQVDARQRLIDSINHAGYVDLIGRCLREEREDRPSANEIITDIMNM